MIKLKDLINVALDIVPEVNADGTREDMGHVADFVYGLRDLDDMLGILKINVEK